MKKLLVASAVIAVLGGISAQALTIKENTVFPETNLIATNLVDENAIGIRDIPSPDNFEANMGQTFSLGSATTLRAITLKSHATYPATYWNAGVNNTLELWIGENDGSISNFVKGTTHLLTSVVVANMEVTAGNYYSFNLDSDLLLPAGDYAFQFQWNMEAVNHQWFLRRSAGGATYADGGLLYEQTDDGTPVAFPLTNNYVQLGNDLVFGLHSAAVQTVPVLAIDPEEISMLLSSGDVATTTNEVSYISDTTMDISISISAETHPTSFSVLSATPQTLTTPFPATTPLVFQFDNLTAGLVAGETATGLVTIAWSETGGAGGSGQLLVPISASTGFAPGEINVFTGSLSTDWDNAGNWDLNRIPGALGADQAIIQGGLTADLTSNFTGLFPWETIVREGATLNISADFLNAGKLLLGRDSTHIGFVNQTAGTVEVAGLQVGEYDLLAASNSVYSLTGGTLITREINTEIYSGVLDINGGAFTLGKEGFTGPYYYVLGTGLIKLQSGTFNDTPAGALVSLLLSDVEISGGTLNLSGQNYFGGECRVIGDDASIFVELLNNNGGTHADYVFEMGATGVSPINVGGWAHLNFSTITVDGSDYTGGSGTFPLMNVPNLATISPVVNVTNFASGVTASITQVSGENGGVYVTINIPGYTGWIGSYGLTGDDADWDFDYDLDGEINFYEYAFGGDPTNGAVIAYVPTGDVVIDGGEFYEYVYPRRIGTALETELDYQALFTTDLFAPWSGTGVSEVGIGTLDPEYEWVTNRVNMAGKDEGFMKVFADQL